MRIGIMGAMPQEIDLIRNEMTAERTEQIAEREFHIGSFAGADCVLVYSRWGKVAAALSATILIERFKVDVIIFTGVAGGVSEDVNVGDIVIADRLLQHDFDVSATGMFPRFEIPLLGISHFEVDATLLKLAIAASEEYLRGFDLKHEALRTTPKVVIGTIASGDQFIASPERITDLQILLPELKAVEMEGAAVAQVAREYRKPFLVLRTISDKADHSAPTDFITFIRDIARHYSHGVLRLLLPRLQDATK